MGQVIPRQHPAVVLKSHYKAVRDLLAVALVAIVALAVTVAILASDADNAKAPTPQAAAKSASRPQTPPAGTRFDGGPDEGTRGISTGAGLPPGTRFDGGPDEGTRGPHTNAQSATPPVIPMGPGGR